MNSFIDEQISRTTETNIWVQMSATDNFVTKVKFFIIADRHSQLFQGQVIVINKNSSVS